MKTNELNTLIESTVRKVMKEIAEDAHREPNRYYDEDNSEAYPIVVDLINKDPELRRQTEMLKKLFYKKITDYCAAHKTDVEGVCDAMSDLADVGSEELADVLTTAFGLPY